MTEPSTTLGHYVIQAELGKGGFATVFRALDTSLNREVALKILHPQLLADRTFVDRFRKEARTLASLRHAHIVTIYEVSEAEGRVFIAMELAHGSSLAQAIADRKHLSWTETLAILKPVTEALDYAHGQGVIHRDLKPANILLDSERGPLLTDFGFARLMGDSSVSMSLSGGILGTPAYIAPEVWELDTATGAADIYALGCIAYEMLTGEVLFSGKTPMQSMRAHDRGPQFATAWPEGVPQGVDKVLQVALVRKPEERYPSAGTLWHALNDVEANAQVAREQAERQAIADQWKAEAETALAEHEWSAAKMAVGRWLSITPEDVAALALRDEIARQEEQEARGKKQEAERVAQAAIALEVARKAKEEQEAAAARKTKEEAEAKTKREADEQERQRQAAIVAQEKAQREAEEKVKRDAEAAITVNTISAPKSSETTVINVTTAKTAPRIVPRRLFIIPALSIVVALLGGFSQFLSGFMLSLGLSEPLLVIYDAVLLIGCSALLAHLIQDNRRDVKDRIVLHTFNKAPRNTWIFLVFWTTVNTFSMLNIANSLGYSLEMVYSIIRIMTAITILGISQWIILREYVDLFGYWVLTNLLAGIIYLLFYLLKNVAILVPLGSFLFTLILILGLIIGFGQWLILRDKVYGAGWWVLANIMGWGILSWNAWRLWVYSDDLSAARTSSVFFGLLTGAVMVWLLRHPKSVN